MLVCSRTSKSVEEVLYLKVVQTALEETNDHELSYLSFYNDIYIELAHFLLELDC